MGNTCHSTSKRYRRRMPFINENGILESRLVRQVKNTKNQIDVPSIQLAGDLLSPEIPIHMRRNKKTKKRRFSNNLQKPIQPIIAINPYLKT